MAFARHRGILSTEQLIRRERRRRQQHVDVDDTQHNIQNAADAAATDDELGPVPPGQKTIFVSVPSYRDPECVHTVADCFAKAECSARVFVGVFEQNDLAEDLPDIFCAKNPTLKPYAKNIRLKTVDCSEAAGPVYARAVIEQELFGGEDFYLCIDSHTLFAPHWDTHLIKQLEMCPSEKAVLTAYPEEYDRRSRSLPPSTLRPCFLTFRNYHERLRLPQFDRVRFAQFPTRPVRSLFWAAGFSFARSDVVAEVPFDPNLKYIFLGEEISMAARLFTHGWDTYCAMTNCLYHYTPRDYRPVFWEQFYKKGGVCKVSHEVRVVRKKMEAEGIERIRSLLSGSLVAPADPYGLGTVRTVEDFEQFVGLDLQDCRHKRHAKWGLTRDADEEERQIKFGKASAPWRVT